MRILRWLALAAVLGIAALYGFLWAEHRMPVTLPEPTGPFPVGRTLLDWRDDGTQRELLARIWYPAASHSGIPDDYVPKVLQRPGRRRADWNVFALLTRDPAKVHGHSLRDAAVAPAQPYPVVIMRAGASAPVANYSTLAEDLASHGYVVVGFDAPYRTGTVTFPDGRSFGRTAQNNPELYTGPDLLRMASRLLAAWTSDVGFALDQLGQMNRSDPSGRFTGRLDLNRVGVFGHSFGGATALQFCSRDPRCKAGIDIDGAPVGDLAHADLRVPFMFLLSDHGDSSNDAETRKIKADLNAIYGRIPADRRYLLMIRGANHFTFSDDGALLKSHLLRGAMRIFGILGIDGRRQLAATAYCVHAFFDAYLKGAGVAPLASATAKYPEVRAATSDR